MAYYAKKWFYVSKNVLILHFLLKNIAINVLFWLRYASTAPHTARSPFLTHRNPTRAL